MFCGIIFLDQEGKTYIEQINVGYISRFSFVDNKNVDAGTYIHMKTNEVLFTPEPMDRLAPRIEMTWREANALLLGDVLRQMVEEEHQELQVKKTRKPRKK